ncbi:unannotated protein [freshwater metagenome]|uniref:Unannotated protein n=1 Tax=freshwater metagenome TaxID=449393 RepID=A0A6J7ELD3_9ZZZZ
MDGRCERRGSRGLGGTVLEVDPELVENVLGVAEHVHQVGDWRSLVTADVGDPRLEEGLGHGEDALSPKLLPGTESQLLDFCRKRTLSHDFLLPGSCRVTGPASCIVSRADKRLAPWGGSLWVEAGEDRGGDLLGVGGAAEVRGAGRGLAQ